MREWSLLRVDLNMLCAQEGKLPKEWMAIGGRSLTSTVIAGLVPPTCNPLSTYNVLVIALGLLGGSGASSSDRLSVGGKSPLTGGIKESNVGGKAGQAFARLGIRCLIFSGCAENWQIVHIDKNGLRFESAEDLLGYDTYQTVSKLRIKYGKNVAILTIGPAGENLLSAANIAVGDSEGIPCRHAGRGGMGAVMGSKHIKAIVIDPAGTETKTPYHPENALANNQRFAKALLANPVTGKSMPMYGTSVLVNAINTLGGLPTRNFSEGSFEYADRISGEALHELIVDRGGKTTHGCMPGCVVRCSNVLPEANGEELTRALEYESIVLLGANCGIGDLEAIARLNQLCDEIGLDTMEIGVAIGIAMEAGLLPFGDVEGANNLIREIGKGTPLGRVIGNGAAMTGKMLGIKRIPVVMGQALSAYDPRSLKGTGVTYGTSPMGADHTAGNALPGGSLPDGTRPDPTCPDNQVRLSRYLQQLAMVFDSLGLCWFTRNPILADPSILANLLHAQCGGDWNLNTLLERAADVLQLEISFNRAAGIGETQDLPHFFRTEPLGLQKRTFDVSVEEMKEISSVVI